MEEQDMTMSGAIVFYTVPLKIDYEEVKKAAVDDELLHRAIKDYSYNLLKEKDIETWITYKNLIVTEDGYKIVFYAEQAKDLEEARTNAKLNG